MIRPSSRSTLFPYTTLFRSILSFRMQGVEFDNGDMYVDGHKAASDVQHTYHRSEERFSRNAETDLVCRLLLEKKKKPQLTQRSSNRSKSNSGNCARTMRNIS